MYAGWRKFLSAFFSGFISFLLSLVAQVRSLIKTEFNARVTFIIITRFVRLKNIPLPGIRGHRNSGSGLKFKFPIPLSSKPDVIDIPRGMQHAHDIQAVRQRLKEHHIPAKRKAA